jgi:hypothetical protein
MQFYEMLAIASCGRVCQHNVLWFFLGLNVYFTQLPWSGKDTVQCEHLHGPAASATRPLTFDALVHGASDDRIGR